MAPKSKQITIAGVTIAALKTPQLRVDMRHNVDVTLQRLSPAEIGVLPVTQDLENDGCGYLVEGVDNIRRFMSGIAAGQSEFACEIL